MTLFGTALTGLSNLLDVGQRCRRVMCWYHSKKTRIYGCIPTILYTLTLLCSVVSPAGKYDWFEESLTAFKPRSKASSQGINLVLDNTCNSFVRNIFTALSVWSLQELDSFKQTSKTNLFLDFSFMPRYAILVGFLSSDIFHVLFVWLLSLWSFDGFRCFFCS